jgi:carbamoyl-phosphate synthase small subunit
MTYPEIGNVGINLEDDEAARIFVEGFVVREYIERPSNWRSEIALGEYLERAGVVGIDGIDTRALVRHIRTAGAQEAVISSVELDADALVAKAKARTGLIGRDLVKEVTCTAPYFWEAGGWELGKGYRQPPPESIRDAPLIVALDYGIKRIFLSNGPADPVAVPYAYEAIRAVLGKKPVFGICLGHQIIGLALGGKTYKLGFGHHGANHPVMDLRTRRVEITSQNHGFAVDAASVTGQAELSHLNLNDQTVEGLRGIGAPFFSVQYHPEASPGPHDSGYLFARFRRLVEAFPRYGAAAMEHVVAEDSEPR